MSCGCIYYRSNIKYMFEVELLNTIFINRASSILMLDDFFEKNWGFFLQKVRRLGKKILDLCMLIGDVV